NSSFSILHSSFLTMILYLVGFMGSGKSTIGNALAEKWRIPLIDLDAEIIRAAGCSIPEIFEREGELGFRQRERETLQAVCATQVTPESVPDGQPECVISLGGGAFTQEAIRQQIATTGVSVWLKASFETCAARLRETTDRPLFQSPATAQTLFESRLPVYALANIEIETDGQPISVICAQIQQAFLGYSSRITPLSSEALDL
ncbi:MAG TPA: shikimate kinase, partial [Acidobacteriota bacterium]|nr:shikimate kinase [Acidobacteriota bacterium]